MMMNDKPLTQNYDSDKEKSEIDCNIRVLKIILDSDLQHISAEEIAFYNKVKLSVSIDSLLLLLMKWFGNREFRDRMYI